MKIIIIFCLILLFFLIFIKFRVIESFQEQSEKSPHIPKIIWTYWNDDDIPNFIQKCIDTWRKHNPSYKINVITPSNLKDFLDIDPKKIKWNDCPAREADIIRILLIEKYGGVWSDASIIMTAPLNINTTKSFYGYYIEKDTSDMRYPILECWFFAAVPRCKFIKLWKEAFFRLDSCSSIEECVNNIKNEGVDFQKIPDPKYLFMNLSAQYVMQKQMTVQEIKETLDLNKAEDGPYKYIFKSDGNPKKSVDSLCQGKYITDIIKLTSAQRSIIIADPALENCVLNAVTQ